MMGMEQAIKIDSFMQILLEVQDIQVPKIFQGFLIELVKASHPLPDNIFDLKDDKFVLVSKAPSLLHQGEEIDEMELLANSINEESSTTQEFGSPLELYDYQKDLQLIPTYEDSPSKLNKNHNALLPMSQIEASFILSSYNIGFQRHRDCQPCRIWVASDGSLREGIVFRSSLVKYMPGGQVIVDSFYVTSKGQLFDPNHVSFVQSMLPPRYFNEECKMFFSSSYCLFGSDDLSTSVRVNFDWEEESAILCPPTVDANANMIIRVDEEASFGPISSFYQELSTVERLVEGITEEVLRWSISTNQTKPLDRMAVLLASVQDQGLKTTQQRKQTENTKKSVFNIHLCPDVDFTDEVWNIMKDCSSYQELLDCFKCLFEAMQAKKIQPLLGSNNRSSLAQLIRSSYKSNVRKETLAWLKDEKPLIMLAEIGIEKLKKDYLYNFMTSGIVTADQLAYFLGSVETDDLPEKFSKLRRLHRVLELCLLLDQNLIMQRSSLMEVLSFSLKYYELHGEKSALSQPFEMPISVLNIVEQVKKASPSSWKCRIQGTLSNGHDVQGCVLLSHNALFQHVNDNISQDPIAEDGRLHYHVTIGNETISCY